MIISLILAIIFLNLVLGLIFFKKYLSLKRIAANRTTIEKAYENCAIRILDELIFKSKNTKISKDERTTLIEFLTTTTYDFLDYKISLNIYIINILKGLQTIKEESANYYISLNLYGEYTEDNCKEIYEYIKFQLRIE